MKINLSFTGDRLKWKTSKNEFSDSECSYMMYVHHTGSLENCTALCLQESDCTAFNYASSSTGCVLRRCKLPIVPPAKNLWPTFDGFWQSSCSVSSGPAAGKDCVFPFTFGGKTFPGEPKKIDEISKKKTYRASKE